MSKFAVPVAAPPKDALKVKKLKKPIGKQRLPKRPAPQQRAPVEHEDKYYMNFDFYFKRTCFRTMTLFFKTAFKPYFDSWKTKAKRALPINDLLLAYTRE